MNPPPTSGYHVRWLSARERDCHEGWCDSLAQETPAVKTDHPIYLFLSTGAEAFRVLTGGHQLVGEYRFCALTIKGLEREPENPYVAVFAPLLIEDDAELQARAPALWRTVQEAPVLPEVRALLSHVLEFWFFERFRGLTAGEIWAMLNLVTPIQETRAYQRGRLG